MAANKKPPSTRALRHFGFVLGASLAAVFGGLLPWVKHRPVPRWPFGAACVLWLLAMVAPRALAVIHLALAKIGAVITKLLSYSALTLIFYVIIAPFSFLMRMFGRDALALKWDAKAPSYRVRSGRAGASRLDQPF
jgi:Saxitoxin biosynthesis operon protein SxtJ